MPKINAEILSNINSLPDTKNDVRELLLWLVSFERDHSDRAGFAFKPEILEQASKVVLKKHVHDKD